MTHSASFTTYVREQYDTAYAQAYIFSESTNAERAVCRVDLPDGCSWVMRGYRRDCVVPEWLCGCGTRDARDWLLTRAATLVRLAHHGYPAPRVVPTGAGALVGESHGWCTLLTTFVEGTVVQPTLAQLRLLGAALGRLHTLPLGDANQPPIGRSWWFAELAVPSALAQLAAIEQLVPAEWLPLYAAFHTTLHAIWQRTDLPYTIIHGDGWAGNAVQTAADEVVLIDWEPSGLGPAVVDLGRLLLECHLDLEAPLSQPIQPDAQRIAAVVDGYCEQRRLTRAEIEMLLEGMRFSVVVGGAWHFAMIEREGWNAKIERRLARRRQRYQVSEEVAQIAWARIRQVQ